MIHLALWIAAFLFLLVVGICVVFLLIAGFGAIARYIGYLFSSAGQQRAEDTYHGQKPQESTPPTRQVDPVAPSVVVVDAILKKVRPSRKNAERLKNWQERMYRK